MTFDEILIASNRKTYRFGVYRFDGRHSNSGLIKADTRFFISM